MLMSETLEMFDGASDPAQLLIQYARAHAKLRAAMQRAPLMRGPRRDPRPLPQDILGRRNVVTFRDAEEMSEALLPLVGDERASRIIAYVRKQIGEAAERDIVPLLGIQVLRAPEGGYVFMPFVVSPSIDGGDPGILTADFVDVSSGRLVGESSYVH